MSQSILNRRSLFGILAWLFMSALTSFISYSLRDRSAWISIPALLIPTVILIICTFVSRSWVYFLGSPFVFTFVITEYLYDRFVVATLNNDLGPAAPLIVLVLFMLVDLGPIDLTRIHSFYLTIVQAFFTVLGIVFMFGVFILQTRDLTNGAQLKNALAGFSSLYATVILLSLTGLLLTKSTVNFSRHHLLTSKIDLSAETLSGGLFFFTFCLVLASTAFLLVLLLLFLRP